jgi:serine protease Do
MTVLTELQDAIRAIAAQVGPSVVGLGRGWGRGSGVVIAPGQVLTNAHVLRGEEVAVALPGGEHVDGRVAGVGADLDLAVVAAETGDAPIVEWSQDELDAGAAVFALANPAGRGLRTTLGWVTATDRSFRGPRGRRITGSIEHTAPLPRGSSGGPLVDAGGRLLGINTIRLDGGFILALPTDASMRPRVEALARGEVSERPFLGVALAPPRASRKLREAVGLPEREGLLVRAVKQGSPADRAGLRRGDLLTGVGGAPLESVDQLLDALAAAEGRVTLTVVRGTEESAVDVAL